ncbi:MAG: HEPN domain-containing protein [Rhodospirillaceae bacterium]|nr:HEPN domain-containing protein [Rhodospirillaceae bacterium]
MRISEYFQKEIADPKRELEAQLRDIELSARFLSKAVALRPRLGRLVHWESIEVHERPLVSEFVRLRDANSRPVLNSLLVVCYGAYEKFIGELVQRLVEAVNQGCKRVDDVPATILRENVYLTGKVYQTVKGQKLLREYDYVALAKALGTCENESSEFVLNSVCFSFQPGIMTSSNLEGLLRRVGIGLNWDRFGSHNEIKGILGVKRTRDCSKALQSSLDELVRVRNIVSHTGELNLVRDVEEVDRYAKLLRIFCTVLASHVGSQIEKNIGKH